MNERLSQGAETEIFKGSNTGVEVVETLVLLGVFGVVVASCWVCGKAFVMAAGTPAGCPTLLLSLRRLPRLREGGRAFIVESTPGGSVLDLDDCDDRVDGRDVDPSLDGDGRPEKH
jgi:hypothetical protein